MDTFPYESWEEASQAARDLGEGYFTFGPGGNTATIILTILGFAVMAVTVFGGMYLENRNLEEHVKRIKDEGMI
jgi:hypothetical protein